MIENSVAPSGHESTLETAAGADLEHVSGIVPRALAPIPPEIRARVLRGVALAAERGDEIERTSPSTYRVPSCTGEGSYLVWLDLRCCSCPDHHRAKKSGGRCKHVAAVEVVVAKHRAARRRDAS